MNWFAFSSSYPDLAAGALRKADYDAFAVMMIDRRRRHRHRGKGSAVWEPKPVVALKGYVFVAEPDLWHINSLKLRGELPYVGRPVCFCGRFRPIRDIDRVLSARGLYFRDDTPPGIVTRKAPAQVRPGDMVRFEMAAETIDAPVMSVDGETLLVKLRTMILGRDTMRLPAALVERVA